MNKTFFTHLECDTCKQTYSAENIQGYCTLCNAPLTAKYDLQTAKAVVTRNQLNGRIHSLWRYRELLPVFNDENIVTLGEGMTPLLKAERIGEDIGSEHLYIKDESTNPTGSFKARGIALAVSKAKELGINEICMPSAGNAGGALAAYAVKAGMKAHIFIPKDTPILNIIEAQAFGADVHLVEGVISTAAVAMNEAKKGRDWFDMSTMKEPYRLEGKKTMGYEIAEQFGWELPDAIFYPTGGGTGLIGMWQAFAEMEALGWIGAKRPKMISVQSSGCAPIVKAFTAQASRSEFWDSAQTVASGLRVPKAFADGMILKAIRESMGCAVAVSDEELIEEIKTIARLEGILLSPEGAATVAGLRMLLQSGFVRRDEKIVLFNTGSGYKYVELLKNIIV